MVRMDVLGTGACGSIGSRLVPLLREHEAVDGVVAFDSMASGSPAALVGEVDADLAVRRGDVREYGDVESATRDVDAVVHLAAITGTAGTHDRHEETIRNHEDRFLPDVLEE